MRKSLLLVAALAGALLGGSALAQNYRAEYRLSTVLNTAFPWGQAGERWAELVKEKTQGRINIKLYPGTSLVGGDQSAAQAGFASAGVHVEELRR